MNEKPSAFRNPVFILAIALILGLTVLAMAVINADPFVDALAGIAAGLIGVVVVIALSATNKGDKDEEEYH